ncbi:putative sugar O-methyltransferase [Nitratireductor sp. XY-223]|uniref:putative sugar O-methyltransferase n=1 Tax=Nitratireductor sp. XY-223 TaxID=2561926 RepID=UPI00145AFA3D|nr:putative sugar O-methyltransferase [Nitratireductor sp. XY-223]
MGNTMTGPMRGMERISRKISAKMGALITGKDYIGVAGNRSESDDRGVYVPIVRAALNKPRLFHSFRRHPHYVKILEHVTEEEGAKYLAWLREHAPALVERIDDFKINDRVGSPVVFDYPGIGTTSPTTLRYIKVLADLQHLFAGNIGNRIAEIGCGYGGQLLVIDAVLDFDEYHLFDLPPVLDLISRYLECFTLNGSYQTLTLNRHPGHTDYDLVISNYAFSELPSDLQRKYISKVLSRSKRGYLTMNSGLPTSSFTNDKLSQAELLELLPGAQIIAEEPNAARDNYILVWGHETQA